MYAGRVLLHYKDHEVWQLTPRFLWSQLAVHFDIESQKWGGKSTRNSAKKESQEPNCFIDEIWG